MHMPQPEPAPIEAEDCEIVQFHSEEEFRTWARENVADWEQFVENSIAGIAEIRAWREAGNSGFPPGYISRREYERQRALRSSL